MQLVTKKLSEIKPYKNNPRKNDMAVDDVAESIRQCDYNAPIVVDENNVILAGHTRMRALQKLGYKEAEVIVKEGLTEKQKKKYRLLDNQTATKSEWDYDKLMQELDGMDFEGFDFGFDLDMDEESEAEAVEDDYDEEPPAEPKSKMGDIYQLGRHMLMCGDSTKAEDVARLMDGQKADMVFTDPPYGVEYTGGMQFKNGIATTKNREMIKNDDMDIYPKVFQILYKFANGPCYIWFADTKARSLYEQAEKYGDIHSLIIWVKNGGYGALNANYKQKHEPCLYWKPKNTKLNFIGDSTETTVWNIDKDGINQYHPTQKPIALAAKAIKNHSAKKILDLFGGSGSTLIACEQLNRTCYMMELDPKYVDVIIDRWEKFTGQKAVKIS